MNLTDEPWDPYPSWSLAEDGIFLAHPCRVRGTFTVGDTRRHNPLPGSLLAEKNG